MVIAKWIPFGAQQAAATENTKPEPTPVISSADAKKFGFENFGNTCYANSVLQALYFCIPFRELLLQSVDQYVSQNFALPQFVPPRATTTLVRLKPPRKYSTSAAPADAPNSNGTPQHLYPPIPSSPPTLLSALRSLFLFISKHPEDKGVVSPRAFIDKLKEANELFRSTMHQDAHEFLNYLLNKVVEEIEDEKRQQHGGTPSGDDLSNSIVTVASRPATLATAMTSNSGTSPQDATLVHKLFEGILTSETRCLTCETVSSRDESFLDLSIDIEQNSSVTACLRQFSASEMLCQKNKFFCDSCCDLQEAEKRMKIKKLPNILALHLKRFKYQEDVQRYIKLAYRVAFPFELRLFNTVDDTDDADRLYELFAIVVHIGNGPHHGHYVSLVKTLGSWLLFDDDVVDSVRESDIPRYFGDSNSGSAYVLYYQAVDIDLGRLGLRNPLSDRTDQLETQINDSHPSPIQPVPALPPGLVEDSSDISDPPLPITPALPPQSFLPIPDNLTGKVSPSLPLKVNGSYLDDPSSLPNVTAPASAIGGLFNSLRRGPSAKVRTSASGLDGRKSYTEPSPRFMMQPTLSGNDDKPKTVVTLPPLLPSPPLPSTAKEKQPERKASTWFKRKGVKMRPETGSEHTPSVVPSNADDKPSPSISSSQMWQRTTGHATREERGSRPSDHALPSDDISLSFSIPLQPVSGVSADGIRNHRSGYDSPSAESASSSIASTSAVHGSLTHMELPHDSNLPAVSWGAHNPSPNSMHFQKQQNKSLTHLGQKGKSPETYEGGAMQLPRRPSSATEGYRVKPPIPPVPRLPPLSPNPGTVEPRRRDGRTIERHDREDIITSRAKISVDEESTPRPNPDNPSHELGLASFAGANNSSTGTASSAGHGPKRSSRKLSLSAPMLGFGRKDKEKQKEKEKDREKGTAQQLNAFAPFLMVSRI